MSSGSESGDHKARRQSQEPDRRKNRKLFVTNLDGSGKSEEIREQLKAALEKYGEIENIVVKNNRNADYSFAFIDMKNPEDADECVRKCSQNKVIVGGKEIKVEFQDNNKRRKDADKGCYTCGQMGHFARECNSKPENDRNNRRRSRSRSEDRDRRRKHKRRHRSDSSDRRRRSSRSSSPKKKDRRNRSRDRDQKKKKKYQRSSEES